MHFSGSMKWFTSLKHAARWNRHVQKGLWLKSLWFCITLAEVCLFLENKLTLCSHKINKRHTVMPHQTITWRHKATRICPWRVGAPSLTYWSRFWSVLEGKSRLLVWTSVRYYVILLGLELLGLENDARVPQIPKKIAHLCLSASFFFTLSATNMKDSSK